MKDRLRQLPGGAELQRVRICELRATVNEDLVINFCNQARELLAEHLHEPGRLLYSGVDTLKESPVVFWGFNPGVSDHVRDRRNWTITDALENLPSESGSFVTGPHPYQRAVAAVLKKVGHPEALVTNLIFFQSPRQHHLGDVAWKINICWPVHKLLFRIARPRVLITTKGVTDQLQTRPDLMAFGRVTERSPAAGWKNWKCWHWSGVTVPDCPALRGVLTIPHPSYWGRVIDTKGEAALRWLSEKVGEALKPTAPQTDASVLSTPSQ